MNTGSTADRVFTIKNTGIGDLTGLTITKDGPDAALFTVTVNLTAPVAPGGSTTFTVRFAPTSSGAKTAALHLANNDCDEYSFDLTLTGTGQSAANQPPVAGADTLNRPNNTRVAKVLKSALLANDTDADSDALSITAVANATQTGAGAATVALAGNFVVSTASANNSGNGSFEYTLSDGAGGHTVTGTGTGTQITPGPSTSGPNAVKIVQSGSDFTVYFIGVPGNSYRVQYTTDSGANWIQFSPLYTAPTSGAVGIFTHTDVAPGDPRASTAPC